MGDRARLFCSRTLRNGLPSAPFSDAALGDARAALLSLRLAPRNVLLNTPSMPCAAASPAPAPASVTDEGTPALTGAIMSGTIAVPARKPGRCTA
jgi:hypothetical protein